VDRTGPRSFTDCSQQPGILLVLRACCDPLRALSHGARVWHPPRTMTSAIDRAPRGALDRFFRITERGSTTAREIRGGLVTFFTAGEKESRAWTVREGSTIRTAAGRIHTDMERGFIAAEVGYWEDIVAAGSWAKGKEGAKIRLEGRGYVVKDGDTVLIRFNV